MGLSNEILLDMYWTMLLARRTDERAWVLHRQGKIAFHISGIGQEAAQVGAAFALQRGQDWISPYYRDLALMLAVGLTPLEFMLSVMGKKGEPSSGARQMPSHWGLRRANVLSHSAPVATQTLHASGLGLAIKLKGDKHVVLTTIGEGSTSQGEWYEAVNWAAIHKLPVIFMVENNSYAISVPQDKQMAVPSAADKACGLGLPGISVDGTDIVAVYSAMQIAVERARSGEGATVIEARAYRLTPHSSDDDDRAYRSREEVETYKKSDPIPLTQRLLLSKKIATQAQLDEMEKRAQTEIEQAVADATAAPYPSPEEALHPVYAEEVTHA
ncbi:MAG: 2-oxoisovalerate dehydrogenase [Chloroflexi bacterium GWB2_49_20]|nr:MAG: 2-oxoisovalerate dehydrogenase [Chloroflexi bacterium GWB2_49_20]OGN80144.1 MAG: 2-oxoisovalerate dehydrogenase [Chloroflexi bacterium GWC2_49_37]OGN83117.1 MAG: 2-oxoisovalerate dehydrogenase [Chloroflexi bacterium GWD2_49_16]